MLIATLRKVATQTPDAILTPFLEQGRSPDNDVDNRSTFVGGEPDFCPAHPSVGRDPIGSSSPSPMRASGYSRTYCRACSSRTSQRKYRNGLAEAKRFVWRCGGMVAADSVVNNGTTIRLFFPCSSGNLKNAVSDGQG